MRIYNRNKNKKIEITRRDTGVFDITSKTYEMAEGDTATFTVKKYLTDTQPVISKTIHPLTESFSLSRTDTDLDYGTYCYDVQLNTEDGQTVTLFNDGVFEILRGVTE